MAGRGPGSPPAGGPGAHLTGLSGSSAGLVVVVVVVAVIVVIVIA